MAPQILFSTVKGEGPTVIMLHGLFGSSDNLSRIAKELEKNYRVYRIDLRNHGASFHHVDMRYESMVDDLRLLMETENIEAAHIIGHSMGGKVAMLFALLYPEKVKKLIVADIAPVNYEPHHTQILNGLKSLPLDKINTRKMADEYLASYIEEPGVRQFLLKSLDFKHAHQARWRFNLTAILENYKNILAGIDIKKTFLGPTLFIAGGLSDYIKPEHKQKTISLFPASQLKVIPETSHWLHAEKPKVFVGICLRFLAEKH